MTHAALIAVASVPLIAQSDDRPTLLEMARQSGGGVTAMIQSCGPTPSLAERVRLADLIVEGIVRTRTSYLTPDGRNIFTDYDVVIRRALFQREMLPSSKPGVAAPVIFKSEGGEIIVEGFRLAVDVRANDARVTLAEGNHVYLLARRDPVDGKWRVGPLDVFNVVNGAIVPPDTFSDVPKSLPADTFVQRMFQVQPAATIRP